MNDLVIETNDLTKCYGEQVCVAQLCLHVPKGKIYALLGRNGAGKTTTMKMLLNLVKPTSGFIKIFNDIHLEDASKAYSRIGALIETPGFYDNLTGRENLEIIARLRGLNSIESVDQALSVVNLDKNDKKIFEKYSLGMKQRLGIAAAIMHKT
ncbi:MAG: ATP-binding cassette domain-containing protein [Roseburia sp.]